MSTVFGAEEGGLVGFFICGAWAEVVTALVVELIFFCCSKVGVVIKSSSCDEERCDFLFLEEREDISEGYPVGWEGVVFVGFPVMQVQDVVLVLDDV